MNDYDIIRFLTNFVAMKNENENDITISDFGNFDVPDLDLDNFDLDLDAEADTANRYIKPRLVPMK